MTVLEFHIIQSFPVSCLNRDDLGSPKTAVVGGVPRARVSSQCWKRAVRMELHRQGMHLGIRTKKMADLLKVRLAERGADEEKAETCAAVLAEVFATDTVILFTEYELEKIVAYAESKEFDVKKIKEHELKKMDRQFNATPLDGLDIALFGRFVAKVRPLNVEAACAFNHAISTHAARTEIDYFTAVDDCRDEGGSGHLGEHEFNSATYYRYVSLNVDQLKATLGIDKAEDLRSAVIAFVQALYVAVPGARQTGMAANCLWDFARIYIRDGQRLQCSFDRPVKAAPEGGYRQPSIEAMKAELDRKEKLAGSLFGKKACIEYGEDDRSIDEVIDGILLALEAA